MKKREEETRPMTSIRRVTQDRELFMPLLLLGDEQLSMIRKYMDTGELFALYDGETPCAVCVVQKTGAAEVVAGEAGCAVRTLDMAISNRDYFAAMRQNIDIVKEALG